MLYVELQGRHLKEAINLRRSRNGNWPRTASRLASRLQRATGIDSDSIAQLLSGTGVIRVPLYAVALLARFLGITVELLLIGVEETDDPNVLSPVDESHIASANSFVDFIDRFHIDFPLPLWDYAFPRHRKGTTSSLTLSDWIALHVEKYGSQPEEAE